MPYASKAQQRWAHSPTGEKALGGAANVHEWDEATDFKSLPDKAPRRKKIGQKNGQPRRKAIGA